MRAVDLIEAVVAGASPSQVLLESFQVTDKDVEATLRHTWDRDVKRSLDMLLDWLSGEYEDNYGTDPKTFKQEAEKYLADWSKAGESALSHIKKGHVDVAQLKRSLIERPFEHWGDPWPVPVYISASPSDRDTIGLLVHKNGKIEMFEGNDEASPDTIELVNELLGLGHKKTVVYGSHDEKLVDQIRAKNELPANLYVSPNKSHAAGYWGEDRILFSVEIFMSAVSQESHVDWKVLKPTKIAKFKYV